MELKRGKTMENKLIKRYEIPKNVRKQISKYASLELYTDRLVARDDNTKEIVYEFSYYKKVAWTPASLATQFAQLVFSVYDKPNIANYAISDSKDKTKIPFCSGMYSYKTANQYVKSLCVDIKLAMDEYNSNSTQLESLYADELKRAKELCKNGTITQKEFDEKRRELYEKNETKCFESRAKEHGGCAIAIIIAFVIFLVIAVVGGFLDKDGDKWNSLSDKEKEWYIDNFGDGQYDEIQGAISDYR